MSTESPCWGLFVGKSELQQGAARDLSLSLSLSLSLPTGPKTRAQFQQLRSGCVQLRASPAQFSLGRAQLAVTVEKYCCLGNDPN